jgi:hypothetical protein
MNQRAFARETVPFGLRLWAEEMETTTRRRRASRSLRYFWCLATVIVVRLLAETAGDARAQVSLPSEYDFTHADAGAAPASGGVTLEAHELAMHRIIQAGAIPMTWQQVMYEWQLDWARVKTADLVREVARQHAGAFGQGVIYAKAMFGAEEGKPLAQPAAASRV